MSLYKYIVHERPLEPPEEEPVAYCACCDGEIYEGETIYWSQQLGYK